MKQHISECLINRRLLISVTVTKTDAIIVYTKYRSQNKCKNLKHVLQQLLQFTSVRSSQLILMFLNIKIVQNVINFHRLLSVPLIS